MSRHDPTHSSQTSDTVAWWIICWSPLAMAAAINLVCHYGSAPPAQILRAVNLGLGLIQLLVAPFIGGFTYSAHADGITVKLGLLRIPIKHFDWSAIERLGVVRQVKPLVDFMGYGLRRNRAKKKTGYIITSGDAVEVVVGGWTYLLIMPDPDGFSAQAERWLHRTR